MSNEIFKWMPHLVGNYEDSQKFRTITTEFENGMSQRRYVYEREVGTWKFNYMVGLLKDASQIKRLQDEIKAFHKARKGAYDNFWLPSWELEGKTNAESSGLYIYTRDNPEDMGFVTAVGEQGNYIYITNKYYRMGVEGLVHEVARISSFGSYGEGYRIVLATALNNSYPSSSKIMKTFRVSFVNDELKRGFDNPYVWSSPIEFKEDIASYYPTLSEQL